MADHRAALDFGGGAVSATGTGALNGVATPPLAPAVGASYGVVMPAKALYARSSTASSSIASSPAGGQAGSQSALIEETGSMSVVVRGSQIQADVDKLMALALGDGGFVAGTSTQSAQPGSPAQGTVTMQVPEAAFGTAIDQVRGLGTVVSLTTSATDVTGQYVDLQAQITALEASRQQYLTIMTKATTIGGILAVQSQLDDLQTQLQQLQGQLKVLTNETTYATLAVTLSGKASVTPPPPKPASGLLKAWRSAVNGFVSGFEGLVRVAGPLLFALLLVLAVYLLGRGGWRLYRRHPQAALLGPNTSGTLGPSTSGTSGTDASGTDASGISGTGPSAAGSQSPGTVTAGTD
jgi:hypothetical protein